VISNEIKLARSEARFGALVEQATDAIFLVGSDGRVLQANRAAEVMYGWTRDELLSMHAADVRASGTRDALRHDMETAAARGSLLVETRHQRADGSELPVEVNMALVKAGDETLFLSIVRDITARKAAEDRIRALNRLLRTISEVNQLLVRGADEESLLKDVCRILVSHGGYALAWVGRADRETMRVVPVASAGDGAGYLQRIEVRWDDTPEGRGPLGIAIRERRSVIVADVQADPMVVPWRRLHPSPGFGSIAAIPIRRGGAVTAGLIVYSAEKAFIDAEELALLEELAGDLSFALDALDARGALRESEENYRALFGGMLHGYFHGEMLYEGGQPSDFIFLEANPAFVKLSGLKDVVGRRVSEVIPGLRQSNPELFEVYGRVAQTGRPETLELYVPALERWFQISAYSRWKGHFIALFDNITDRKRAAEELARKELYFRSLIEHSLDIVAVIELDGKLGYVSPAIERILGYQAAEAVGLKWLDLLHPDDRAAAEDRLREVLEIGSRHEQIELRMRHRDGTWRTLSFIGKSLPAETAMHGVILNARDLTESRRLEAELRASQKMDSIGRLAGGIAHDFNNLLTAILGYAELMEPDLAGQDHLQSSLREIRLAGERAAALTRQLLAFSRRQVLQPRLLDLNAVVSEVEKLLRRLIGEDVELVTRLDPGLGSVKADPGQLEQVLMNLAVNARDAMPKGGTLTVETANTILDTGFARANPGARSGEYAVLTVADTGIGMSDEVRSHAFEPFFTTKEKGKGTGLGLATAYGIVKQSDGYITVESEPGRGATFRIYFPRAAGAAAASGRGEHPALSPRGTETILVVEDESGVRRLSRAILKAQGYIVLEAASGDEALEVARSHAGQIHLVATDVIMPGMSGHVLWDRLRVLRPDSRVLFMSGYTDDAIATHGVLEPGIAFLQKPFTPFGLAQKVREVLDAAQGANA
jgi:PAS domain S-box-containing protein